MKFLTVTAEPSAEGLRAAWEAAGGRVDPTADEAAELRRRMTLRQRVYVDHVREWIAAIHSQGLVVVDVAVATPPIA